MVSKRNLQAADHLEARLKSRHEDAEDILGLTLANAIFHGGHLRPELVWLNLEVNRSSKRIAQSVEVESFRFFPDVTTLALIGLCKRAGAIEVPNTPRALLRAALSAIGAGELALSPQDIRLSGSSGIRNCCQRCGGGHTALRNDLLCKPTTDCAKARNAPPQKKRTRAA